MGVETLKFSEALEYFKLNFLLIFLNMTNVGHFSTKEVLMTMVMMMSTTMMALAMMMMMMALLLATIMMRKSSQEMCTGEILQGTSKTGGHNWTIFHSLKIHF